jgi:hypothetical protein
VQSESSLKGHLHCLGPQDSIVSYLHECATTAAFGLGAAKGI